MKRKVTLSSKNATDRRHYTLLCNALATRGSQSRDPRTGDLPRLSKDEKRSDARIRQALWKLGAPDVMSEIPAPKGDEPDLRPLKLTGGALILDQPDWTRLLAYVELSQWTVHFVSDGVELEDRLDGAEKIDSEGDVAEIQGPRRRRLG